MRVGFPVILVAWTLCSFPAIAQVSDVYRLNQETTHFKEGLFATFGMFRNNRPIAPASIETEVEISDPDFYERISRRTEMVYYDENGVRQVTATDQIWGYIQGGNIYIRIGSAFHKLSFLGRFSWFVASITTSDSQNSSVRQYTYRSQSYSQPDGLTTMQHEYLVDLQNNIYWDFDVPGLEMLLRSDPYLLDEFNNLKHGKKMRMRYIFLQRCNEQHPFSSEAFAVHYSDKR